MSASPQDSERAVLQNLADGITPNTSNATSAKEAD
jgi:hypothetical protein